jgi:lysophospholipase L1-like esterase
MLKNLLKNSLILIIGLTLSFALLEGLLRVFQPIEYRVKGDKIKLPRDKNYQFINDKTDKLDKIIYTTRNHAGFRGEAPPTDFADCLSIIAVGGSTTECLLIPDGKTWCDILAKKLQRHYKPVWVGNGGLDGTSTYGHLVFLKDYIIKMHPKVVLFLVGANDIGLGTHSADDLKHLKKPSSGWLASCWERLINHSEVLGYAINFYRYSKATRMGLVHAILNFAELPQVEIPPEKVRALLQEHQETYLKPYAQRLIKLIEICRQNSIEPVFITQPTVFGDLIDPATGADLGKAISWSWNGKTTWEILELYNETLRTTAGQHHVFVIDLAREMPKSTEFFYDNYHFTNIGCQQVAAIIDKHLEPFLAERYSQYLLRNHAANY